MSLLVAGSFERNTGTWCPYPVQAEIEAAYASGAPSIFLPTCFNATVHFERRAGPDRHHYQRTPAVGSKPAGLRSVSRGIVGEFALLYWWGDLQMWRLEQPQRGNGGQTQQVEIYEAAEAATAGPPIWQWCDMGDAGAAKEMNWHYYGDEISGEIEAAWAAGRQSINVVVGITTYTIAQFSGAYAVQRNAASGGSRMVRRYQSGLAAPPPPQLSASDAQALQGDSCALCTEEFAEHPEWPITRTPCGHAFHHTCVQSLLVMGAAQRKCPLCRTQLEAPQRRPEGTQPARPPAASSGARSNYTPPVGSAEFESYQDYMERLRAEVERLREHQNVHRNNIR